jgi:antirestriction protein ArdC
LIAEIGSASLMNIIGIETGKTFQNSTAYIQSWLSVLKNDVKFIVSASSKAEKAVNYILNEA